MKNPSVSDSCFSLNMTDQDVKEGKSKKDDGENEKVEAYEKFTQKYEVLAHGSAPKCKEKPIPSNLKYEPPNKRKRKEMG